MKNIYIIAEIGQAHEGSVGLAHSYIDALANTGINAIKFQMHIAEAESSIYESFRIPFSYEDDTRLAYWKRMEFSKTHWVELKEHCEVRKLDFIVSPFSVRAVETLNEIGVATIKIGSGELDDFLILDKISDLGKNIILSSGMSSLPDLDYAVDFLKSKHCSFALMQCTTAYPTRPRQWGLNMIAEFSKRYQIPIGFSDHSGDIYACLAAASLGARLLEFHVTFDKRMFGPDSSSSLTIDQVHKLVKGVRQIEIGLVNPINKADPSDFRSLKSIFGKSLAVNKPLKMGHLLAVEDLESKKPAGYGVCVKSYKNLLGKALAKDVDQWDFLTENHFS
ncbi:N-acetylneuraminate synthase family protein [Dyadobacter arcticus]|uniref:N-acetylneuraminate synthase n=1 Tax=Dyadobacter arcticus TaxID=1078754 RepID=A0ABX0USY7_9BACT|nr:N-acetylneuraminate synthase family protein [Dyadobacter arcticus]NIJ55334.1 N-acetylneuraminate synthase [Dyadobacter arcticus]